MRLFPSAGLFASLTLLLAAGCAGSEPDDPGPGPGGDDDGMAGDDDAVDDDVAADDDVADDDVADDDSEPAGNAYEGVVTGALEPDAVLLFRSGGKAIPVRPDADGRFTVNLDPDAETVAWLIENGHVTAVVLVAGDDGDHVAFLPGDGSLALSREGKRIFLSGEGIIPIGPASSGLGLECGVALGACSQAMIVRAAADDADGDGDLDAHDHDDDGDLVPDAADPDDDGDGIFDSLDVGGFVTAAASMQAPGLAEGEEPPVEGEEPPPEDGDPSGEMTAFTNLKLDGSRIDPDPVPEGDDDWPYTEEVVLTLEWYPPPELQGTVQTVTAITLPFNAEDARVAPGNGGFPATDEMSTYPEPGSAWDGMLRRADFGSGEVWTIWVQPLVDLMSGDMLVFEVVAESGVYHLEALIDFPLRTPPLMERAESAYGSVAVTYPVLEGDPGSMSSAIPFSGDLVLYGSRPKTDATGAAEPICGMGYRADIFYLDASGAQIGGMLTEPVWDTAAYPCEGEVSITLTEAELPTTFNGQAVAGYKIDFTAVGARGDNSSAMLTYERMPE